MTKVRSPVSSNTYLRSRRTHPRRPLAPLDLLLALSFAACGDAGPTTPSGGTPAAIEIVAGGAQRAVQGLSLEERIVVRVLDTANRPVPGASVEFEASHAGRVDSASTVTDADGRASAVWVLGPDAGLQELVVAADPAGIRVSAEALDLETELDALFGAATRAEIDAVRWDWAGREAPVEEVRVEHEEDFPLGRTDARLRIVSHKVTGFRHYGAIITPDGAETESLPILVYLHGGENGVSTDEARIFAFGLGEELVGGFVYVLPSYRSETLHHGEARWVSEGPASPWDYDADDVIALVNVALATTPEAKPDAYRIIGGSRGGAVATLTGIRDPRVERIVSFFGPTDFFDDWVRDIVREAALRMPRDLTGVTHFDSTVVQPYVRGEISLAQARMELARRSSVLFVADIPPLQVHHGTIDEVVSVSQAESMRRAMESIGRVPPDFELHIYEGGGHDFLSLRDAIPRAAEFLTRGLGSVVAGSLRHARHSPRRPVAKPTRDVSGYRLLEPASWPGPQAPIKKPDVSALFRQQQRQVRTSAHGGQR